MSIPTMYPESESSHFDIIDWFVDSLKPRVRGFGRRHLVYLQPEVTREYKLMLNWTFLANQN